MNYTLIIFIMPYKYYSLHLSRVGKEMATQ